MLTQTLAYHEVHENGNLNGSQFMVDVIDLAIKQQGRQHIHLCHAGVVEYQSSSAFTTL